ncbi:hypothetical protein, partial [Aquisphaera insulae]|uniref:hypothetical protein n=1 Tax=Aquisphaera insulae TaxID=2712864 RepID=UPI0013EBAC2B
FGPAGGLKSQLESADLPSAVADVQLIDLFDESETVEAGHEVLLIPGAGPIGTESRTGDIVAIRSPAGLSLEPRPLATEMPKPGERVWLAASLLSGAPRDQRLHPAKVEGPDEDGFLLYALDDPKTELRATSGAPILNADGEVVAVHAGSTRDGERLLGVGTPFSKFLMALRGTIAKSGEPPRNENNGMMRNTPRRRRPVR